MSDSYGSHHDYMSWVAEKANQRQIATENMLREAFAPFIETRAIDVIVFSNISVFDLARALQNYPVILKPLISVCNIAGRAIERDLQIKNIDTYAPKLNEQQS